MASVEKFPGHVYRRLGRDAGGPAVKRPQKIGKSSLIRMFLSNDQLGMGQNLVPL